MRSRFPGDADGASAAPARRSAVTEVGEVPLSPGRRRLSAGGT